MGIVIKAMKIPKSIGLEKRKTTSFTPTNVPKSALYDQRHSPKYYERAKESSSKRVF